MGAGGDEIRQNVTALIRFIIETMHIPKEKGEGAIVHQQQGPTGKLDELNIVDGTTKEVYRKHRPPLTRALKVRKKENGLARATMPRGTTMAHAGTRRNTDKEGERLQAQAA